MRFKYISCIFFFISISFSVFAEDNQRLLPSDEAERDLSFVEFREQLKVIVQNRDPEGFVKFVYQQVSVPNNKSGMRQFVKFWEPEATESELWPTMETILNMGGSFVRSERGVTFCAPYVFTNFPGELDIYGHGVIVRDKVVMKTAPSNTAQTVTTLSYNILKVEDWRSVEEKVDEQIVNWIKVTTMDGIKGYVDKKMVRSPTDYAACFLFRPKVGWKIISLVSNE